MIRRLSVSISSDWFIFKSGGRHSRVRQDVKPEEKEKVFQVEKQPAEVWMCSIEEKVQYRVEITTTTVIRGIRRWGKPK